MEQDTHAQQLERINAFLEGHDPMERIVAVECNYNEDCVYVIYNDSKGIKRIRKDAFKPFVWAKHSVTQRMCLDIQDVNARKRTISQKMREYGIKVKKLDNGNSELDRLKNGYLFLFYADKPMSQNTFNKFFEEVGTPIRKKETKGKKGQNQDLVTQTREFLAVSQVEQYLIATGKRFFKGYNRYDELKRLMFDIETTGLNPHVDMIDQIGVRTNKGFEEIINIEGETKDEKVISELKGITRFTEILKLEKPDIVGGHNSEIFDWDFIMTRCEEDGISFKDISQMFFPSHPIVKKQRETVLKIGAEVEYYKPTVMWGHTILDSLHAVRRAQAQDSSMKLANLKYVTKYLKLNKPNRVYVKGEDIGTLWRILDPIIAFNDKDGTYYPITEEKPLKEGYKAVSGKYIVERYLKDDIWETDKVELALNEANFLVCKIVPTSFQRCATMGTATIWKLITLAWCYENGLAVPAFGTNAKFVGGLSRLLLTGYAKNVVKLDYNSLYPSITITWGVASKLDISNSLLLMLEYVLTQREKYKGLKKKYANEAEKLQGKIDKLKDGMGLGGNEDNISKEDIEKLEIEMQEAVTASNLNDKLQLPLKIMANSFFGSYGCPQVYPLGDIFCAEKITCIGRQCLRLMISHFSNLGYKPIVGDSFTSDTPLFIKYNDTDYIDIKTIGELISEKDIQQDILGREYDYSAKPYKVLCRSGWVEPNYIYRHKTTKPLYDIKEGNMVVSVTEDHSLFNDKQEKIKPSQITQETNLEYYDGSLSHKIWSKPFNYKELAKDIANNRIDFPIEILNAKAHIKHLFLKELGEYNIDKSTLSKKQLAELLYINKSKKE